MSRTPEKHPDWWVAYRNPYPTQAELDRACRTRGSATGWAKSGKMPWWVELILDLDSRPPRPLTLREAAAFINTELEADDSLRLQSGPRVSLYKIVA